MRTPWLQRPSPLCTRLESSYPIHSSVIFHPLFSHKKGKHFGFPHHRYRDGRILIRYYTLRLMEKPKRKGNLLIFFSSSLLNNETTFFPPSREEWEMIFTILLRHRKKKRKTEARRKAFFRVWFARPPSDAKRFAFLSVQRISSG